LEEKELEEIVTKIAVKAPVEAPTAAPVEQSVAASSEIHAPKEWIVQTDWSMLYKFLEEFQLDNYYGLDIKTQILKVRLSQKQLYDTICLEPILRQDLWKAFLNKVAEIRSGPRNRQRNTKIEFAFHGTLKENLPSIVRHGFLIPERLSSEPGCGHASIRAARLGLGIYCTPDVVKAFQYTGSRIILCAVIRGKPYHCDNEDFGEIRNLKRGYDSHRFEDEWAVFHSDQIVPLCVMHLKAMAAATLSNPGENDSDSDEKFEFNTRWDWEHRVDMESICSRKHFQYQYLR
jgi:hypothetical protein